MKTLNASIIALLILVILPLNNVYAQTITNSVLFMKSNSTAKIYTDFIFRVLDNQTWNLNPQIFTSSTDPNSLAKDLIINASPNSLIANKNNVSVVYTITAKSDTKGVYGLFLYFCGMLPIVVGQNESEVNPAILHNFLTAVYNCPAETESTPYINIVGHSGIISKVITINANNTITVYAQNGTTPNNFYQPPPPPNPVVTNQTAQFPISPALQIPIYLSPLMQFKQGTPVNDVKCNDGLQLLIKAEDGSPACVKPDTVQKLIERGWGNMLTPTAVQRGPPASMPITVWGNQATFENAKNVTGMSWVSLPTNVPPNLTLVPIRVKTDPNVTTITAIYTPPGVATSDNVTGDQVANAGGFSITYWKEIGGPTANVTKNMEMVTKEFPNTTSLDTINGHQALIFPNEIQINAGNCMGKSNCWLVIDIGSRTYNSTELKSIAQSIDILPHN